MEKIKYDFGDGSYIPPSSDSDTDISDTNNDENKSKKTKKYKKRRKEKTVLDLLVEEIIEDKKNKNYQIRECSDEDFKKMEEAALREWTACNDKKEDYDNDYDIFILAKAVIFCFEHEQQQKQIAYGAKEVVMNSKVIYAVAYKEYMSYEERINDGYFTCSEKERLSVAMENIAFSVYRKYVPNENQVTGPYEKEEIKDAVYYGMAKALNTYLPLSDKTRVSFSSWAYTCMNNACLDVIKYYKFGKRGEVIKVSIYDNERADNGQSNEAASQTNSLENILAVNENNEEYSEIEKDYARKDLLTELFDEMKKNGNSKVIDKQIFILKAYFGLVSDNPLGYVDIAAIINTNVKTVKLLFEEAKQLMVQSAFKLGYTPDMILEMFC